MKIIAIADTHGFHQQIQIPDGDVLIVGGDICRYGRLEDVKDFSLWLRKHPCRYKIVVAGNHDQPLESESELAQSILCNGMSDVIYLQDSFVEIENIGLYGSPWTPTFMDWCFMAGRGVTIWRKWQMIPKDIDVLITHGPPATILDNVRGMPQGCDDLLTKVKNVQPHYHVFGHIHEGYGITRKNDTTFINASVCDDRYNPVNQPVVFSIPSR